MNRSKQVKFLRGQIFFVKFWTDFCSGIFEATATAVDDDVGIHSVKEGVDQLRNVSAACKVLIRAHHGRVSGLEVSDGLFLFRRRCRNSSEVGG
jgi:hypothetical protein